MNEVVFINSDLSANFHKAGMSKLKAKVLSAISLKNSNGYKVVSVTPLTGGHSETDIRDNRTFGFGYGYTVGIMIVFEKT